MNICDKRDADEHVVLLRVDGEWQRYEGTTGTKKLYLKAYTAYKAGGSYIWVYEYGRLRVTGAIFPDRPEKYLTSTVSMDGVGVADLPTRFILKPRPKCTVMKLGNGEGSICTYCGCRL